MEKTLKGLKGSRKAMDSRKESQEVNSPNKVKRAYCLAPNDGWRAFAPPSPPDSVVLSLNSAELLGSKRMRSVWEAEPEPRGP